MCNVKNHKINCLCKPPSQLGKKRSDLTRLKLSLSHRKERPNRRGVPIFKNRGENHFNWKGDDVKYLALHTWITRKLGKPDTCEHCGKSKLNGKHIHWANKNHTYKRNLNDWIRLCVSCHRLYDNKKIIIKSNL
jgi:hypothetical protein